MVAGEAYGLPFHESFANATAATDIWITEVVTGEQSWALALDMDIEPVVSQDGDNGVGYFYSLEGFEAEGMLQSPVLSLAGCDDPVAVFYAYHSGAELPGDYYLQLQAAADGYAFAPVGDRILFGKGEEAGWKQYVVSLADYAGKDCFQFAFLAHADGRDDMILVDNVEVKSYAAVRMESMAGADVSVRGGDQCVVVEGAGGESIRVYAIDGRLVYALDKAEASVRIPLPDGLYVVRAGGMEAKAVVR